MINYVDNCADIREWSPGVVEKVIEEKRKRMERIGIKIDEKKTEVCIFRRRRKDQKEKPLEGTKEMIMYLVMRMNKKLT